MHDRSLQHVRKKFVELMRADPMPLHAPAQGSPSRAHRFDRWIAARFSAEEVDAIFRLEREYGERALDEWLTEIALEAQRDRRARH